MSVLIAQCINLTWHKDCRGGAYATLRNNMPKGYRLPDNFYQNGTKDIAYHYLCLAQTTAGISCKRETISILNCSGLEILSTENAKDIYFKYNFTMGMPIRDYKFYKTKLETDNTDYLTQTLSEKAFHLEIGNYGRIIYNGIHTNFSGDCWWYEMNIFNLKLLDSSQSSLNIFKHKPDFVYKQVAFLF